jgi:hypothetical protein
MSSEPSNRLLILVATLGLIPATYFALKATGTRQAQPPHAQSTTAFPDPTENLYKPTIDLTAVYMNDTPLPIGSPTPIDPSVGEYVGWTKEAVATHVATLLDDGYVNVGPITVLLARDVYASSAQTLVDAEAIAYNGEPDVAIVMSGSFHNPMPYDAASAVAKPFMVVLVDRISGSMYMSARSKDLESLVGMLPAP